MVVAEVRLALAPHMGSEEAKRLVAEAVRITAQQNRNLVDVVRVAAPVELDWDSLKDESSYLGVSDEFISQVLEGAGRLV